MSMGPDKDMLALPVASTLVEGFGYAAFVTLLFRSGCRGLIVLSADVRPERRGNGGN